MKISLVFEILEIRTYVQILFKCLKSYGILGKQM